MGPASAGGSGGGGSVFIPPNQSGVAGGLGDLVNPLAALSGNAGVGTPAGQNYPTAQSLTSGYLTQNPWANQAIDAAQNAYNFETQGLFPLQGQSSAGLFGAGNNALGYAGNIAGNAFDPNFNAIVSDYQTNPFYMGALGGAQQGASLGGAGANAMQGAGNQILNTGFDPQNALFNRTQQQVLDQSNAVNAMSGLSGTPYGASTTANALGNFDINWQNNQLGRETSAAGAASPLFQAAPGLAAGSAALPSGVYRGLQSDVLGALQARNQAGNQGAAGLATLLGAGGNAIGAGNSLGTGAAGSIAQLGGLPYSTGATVGNNALSGLSSLTNLGNNQFLLPQQIISDLMQYMGLGQNASVISNQLGQSGFNQLSQGIGGLGSLASGAKSLFGGGGSEGGGGLLSSLFGGGGGSVIGGDFGGGGPAGDFAIEQVAAPAMASSL